MDSTDSLLFAPKDWRLDPSPTPPIRAFANRAVFLPAWFAVAKASRLRRGTLREVSVGPRRLVLWRDADGVARAFDAKCPHLGANLAAGCVVNGELRCALHHWRYGPDGAVTASPGTEPVARRRAVTYPVIERYGLIFVYPGRSPAPALPPMPDGDDEVRFHRVTLPAARLRCHHHLTTANGLDALHFDALHDVQPTAEGRFEVDEAASAVHLELSGVHRSRLLRALTGGHFKGRFSAIGPSIAWVTLFEPVRWHALFVTHPTPSGGSESRAIFFIPKGRVIRTARSVLFLMSLLRQDGEMLNAFETFEPAFVHSDAPLAAYGRLLDNWPRE